MSASPKIIIYGYPGSPFFQKLSLLLLLKQVPYSVVAVPMIPPRPALLSLGINYRRVPVMAIDNDLFFDTSLAARELDARFPESGVRLFEVDKGLQEAAGLFWADRTLFRFGAPLISWSKFPPALLEDRVTFRNAGPIDPVAFEKQRPETLSTLRCHMRMIETQLSTRTSSSSYLLDTPNPTYLDIAVYFSLNWFSAFPSSSSLFPSPAFPLLNSWMESLRLLIKQTQDSSTYHPATEMSSEDAKEIIWSSPRTLLPDTDDEDPLLAKAGLGGVLEIGSEVEVTSDDTGMTERQKGILRALNTDRVVIEVEGDEGRKVMVHAPRLGFTVRPVEAQ